MKELTILCVGGDMRQAYMSRKLSESAQIFICGIAECGGNVISLDCLSAMSVKADVLVLPIMQNEGLEIPCTGGKKLFCNDVVKHLKNNALVTGGRLSIKQIEFFSALGYDVTDYFKREELVIKNCIPTAEGALQIAMQESGTTIFGSQVLVTGYGRVAKATSNLFKNVGANTMVTARKNSALAEAENNGFKTFYLDELYGLISKFDLIINTIPSMIFDENMLEAVGKDTLLIDLSSKPGGVDFEAAKKLNKRVIHALSLPGKCAPISSGEIIADTIRNILQERGKRNADRKN